MAVYLNGFLVEDFHTWAEAAFTCSSILGNSYTQMMLLTVVFPYGRRGSYFDSELSLQRLSGMRIFSAKRRVVIEPKRRQLQSKVLLGLLERRSQIVGALRTRPTCGAASLLVECLTI